MHGLHLTADLYQCSAELALLTEAGPLADLCRHHTCAVGLTLVAEKWHAFPPHEGQPGGVTGMLLLAESHLAVHTWPERGGVTLDVYVCNFMDDNSTKAEALMQALVDAFKPAKAQLERLQRGIETNAGSQDNGELVLESLNAHTVYGFRFTRRLLSQQTGFQRLELLESPELGRTLRLDDHFMTSEADEFFYHEALVHPAAMAHPNPGRALVVGGGDGGAIEELLKYESIAHVDLVELDATVVNVARAELQNIHQGAFDDPRVAVHIQDGAAFLEASIQAYDLILLDLTDPETPAGPLYTVPFFDRCKQALAPGGAVVLHLGAPFHEPEQVRHMAALLHCVFPQVHGYGLHIPLYGAYWALAIASDTLEPSAIPTDEIQDRLNARRITGLQYYNAPVHGALFALPTFYQTLMPTADSAKVCG